MAHDQPPRPTLILFPADDETFAVAAEQWIEDGSVMPEDLQAALRTRWPLALVRPRGLAGEHAAIWYVYRDGHWIRTRAASFGRRQQSDPRAGEVLLGRAGEGRDGGRL